MDDIAITAQTIRATCTECPDMEYVRASRYYDLRTRLAEVEAERDGLRDHLAWYADTFCEKGPYSEVCGRLTPDECAGCRARAALGAKP